MAGIVADRVVVELEAKLDRYNANVRAAEQRFDAATRGIQEATRRTERQMTQSTAGIGNSLKGLAGTFAAAFSAQQVASLADGYTRFTNQLKLAGQEGERLGDTQNALFGIAQKYGVELESLGNLYGKGSAAAKDLGASQGDVLKFVNATSAALKINGGSAASAAGALQQLSQAVGGAKIQAEEFNSINDGARPILVAVAKNIDAAGGSVSRLKGLVNDGKVTSQEFFQAFLKGSGELEAQAEKASLTISASFTILNNALGKYIGETDASLSATERVSAAIIKLSENLDTVVTGLAVIGTLLGSRYVAGMVAAASSTGLVSTAIFAMQARAVGAATTMEALALTSRAAGASMLAAFGGPVGLAIAALAAGVYYLSTRVDESTQASAELTQAQSALTAMQARARGAVDALATATGKARAESVANARALQQETIQYIAQARAAVIAAKAKREAELGEARARVATASRNTRGAGGGTDPLAIAATRNVKELGQADADLRQATANLSSATKTLDEINAALKAPPPVRSVTPVATKPTKTTTPKGDRAARGADPDDIARRFQDDLARGQLDYEQAMADLAGTARARLDAERRRVRAEEASAIRAINADKDYTEAQKAKLRLAQENVAAARLEALAADERQIIAEEELAARTAGIELSRDVLQSQLDLAGTDKERHALALRLLALAEQEERARLKAVEANEQLSEAERQAATKRLAALDTVYGNRREGVDRQYEGAGERLKRSLNADDLMEQIDRVKVDGLKSLEDQIVSTTSKIFKMGGAFGDIANQIISDLLRIAVQQAIIKPLAGLLFPSTNGGASGGGLVPISGGGGGIVGAITNVLGSIFSARPGRASGGHVRAGGLYRVNENGVEGFQPSQSGQIVPLGRMRGAGGGGTIVNQSFVLDARYGITTPELLRQVNSIASARAAQAGRGAFDAAQRATPGRISKLNRLGT